MNEDLGASVPEGAPEGYALGGMLFLTFRTIFRSSEAILAEPPEERGRRAIHQLFQMT
jgi:hypothetical protein